MGLFARLLGLKDDDSAYSLHSASANSKQASHAPIALEQGGGRLPAVSMKHGMQAQADGDADDEDDDDDDM